MCRHLGIHISMLEMMEKQKQLGPPFKEILDQYADIVKNANGKLKKYSRRGIAVIWNLSKEAVRCLQMLCAG